MFDCTGSSHQDGVLLWELGLAWGASLNCEETLLTREFSARAGAGEASERPNSDLAAMCCRHRSCRIDIAATMIVHQPQRIGIKKPAHAG